MSDQEKRPITAEDLYDLALITAADMSPDGRHVIYSVQRTDRKTEKKHSDLWLVDTADGEPRRFTYGDYTDAAPKWSPDGTQIAFISNRTNERQPQIYVMPVDGGEARPVTDLEGSIGAFEWSPDGTRFVMMFRKKDEEAKERETDELKKQLGIVERHITRVFYRNDGAGYTPAEKWHIWTADVADGEAMQLTDGDFHEMAPTWSPDGTQIAFLSNRNDDWEFNFDLSDLYLIPVEGGEMVQIPAHTGDKSAPRFSPDGTQIAYRGRRLRPGQWWQNEVLFVVPVDAEDENAVRDIAGRHDYDLGSSTLGDFGSPPDLSPPTWSNDGEYLYATATRHGGNPFLRFRVDDGQMESIIDDGRVVGFFSLDAAQEKMVYFHADYYDPGQLHLYDLAGGEEKALTAVNRDLLDQIEFGEIEEVWMKGPDDNDLHGWILTPPGFDPEQRYPSILEIHGGPQTQYGRTFMHEFFYLAAQGYVVYWSNPRGGQGYGEEHAGAIYGQWGTVDYADLMAWTDYVAELSYIDTERMGICGGSYGGYMTAYIIGQTNRFKAAVPQRMVSNLISFHGTSDFNWGVKYLVGLEGEPWNNLGDYWRMSPISLVGNVETPTLVIHAEQDLRCAKEQGEQYYVALKVRGIDTELVLFPDENHGLSRAGRTDRRIARLGHIRRWFNKYLKDEDATAETEEA